MDSICFLLSVIDGEILSSERWIERISHLQVIPVIIHNDKWPFCHLVNAGNTSELQEMQTEKALSPLKRHNVDILPNKEIRKAII